MIICHLDRSPDGFRDEAACPPKLVERRLGEISNYTIFEMRFKKVDEYEKLMSRLVDKYHRHIDFEIKLK